jgi:ribosomal protein L3 glutamine methyltransferase
MHGWVPTHRRVLDLCTGNGSLAVLAAMAWPDVAVTRADCRPMRSP